MNNNDEIITIQNHLKDLAKRSYSQNIYTFSGFLSMSEADAYYRIEHKLTYASPELSGGYEGAERMLVRFGNEVALGYEEAFPIVCLHITPRMEKFAEGLSHRDYLGALMSLGIERSVLGDIKAGEKEAYIFCLDSMAQYICDNLDQIKHTYIKCEIVSDPAAMPQEHPEKEAVQVSSARVDALISKVYNLSRSDSLDLFREGKVFVNGRLCENNSKSASGGDVINARGYGKFKLVGEPGTSKKGKLIINLEVYR